LHGRKSNARIIGALWAKVKLVAKAAHAPANPAGIVEQPSTITRHSGYAFLVEIIFAPLFYDEGALVLPIKPTNVASIGINVNEKQWFKGLLPIVDVTVFVCHQSSWCKSG
jgi:hypothetical protein